MDKTITIKNVGPVEDVTIPLTDGVVVLRGMNDSGKSTTLEALSRLLGGDARIKRRYGTPHGVVEGLGATIRVVASPRQTGEVQAWAIEGKLALAALVDPGIADPVAADRKRVKALLTIQGVTADATLFHDLFESPEAFDAIASTGARNAADVVEMAGLLKRDAELAARKLEDDATAADGKASGCRESAGEIDTTVETEAEKLQADLEAAIREEARLGQQQADADEAAARIKQAKIRLAGAQADYQGPSEVEAAAIVSTAERAEIEADEAEQVAKQAHERTVVAVADAEHRRALADECLMTARQHDKVVAECVAAMSGTMVMPPDDDMLDRAAVATSDARLDVEAGALARRAVTQLAQADGHQQAAEAARTHAQQLRDAAAGTFDVLAEVIESDVLLPVSDDKGRFRLAVEVDGADQRKYYHDLGPGERWTRALTEGANRVRALGAEGLAILVIPQPAWEGLDWRNREIVDAHCRALGVTVLTGEASKQPGDDAAIRGEVFLPGTSAPTDSELPDDRADKR